MEKFSSVTKRKKRKTRKCLDELRKRSRIRRSDLFAKGYSDGQNANNSEHDDTKNGKSLITLNRLTLAMFPKAVRSETITRPILAKIKQKPHFNESENPKFYTTITSGTKREPEIVLINNNVAHSMDAMQGVNKSKDQNGMDEAVTYKESTKVCASHSNQESHSSDSLILLNPLNQTRENTKLISIMPSSQSSVDDYGYNLYEELMAEIPIYLKEKTSNLIKEDVIKKTRALLQRLYIKSCHQECEDNVLKCRKSYESSNILPYTHIETIVQNPIDYIRLEYERRQNTLDTYGSGHSSSSPLDPHSSLRPLESSTPQLVAVVHDTPEYSYYPHKLNQ